MLGRILGSLIRPGVIGAGAVALNHAYQAKVYADKSNVAQYHRHPSDFIHGIFSALIYEENKEGQSAVFSQKSTKAKYNSHLKDWEVQKVMRDAAQGDYYGAIYVNPPAKQVVVSHRGTTLNIVKDPFKSNTPWKTNFDSIIGNKVGDQQVAAFEMTKAALEFIKVNPEYKISFTGHSLGARLAEMSLYWCHFDPDIRTDKASEIKAVTFDSPGTRRALEGFKPNIGKAQDLDKLDVVTYLSEPNIVNSCNPHIGMAYQIAITLPSNNTFASLLSTLNSIPKVGALITNNKFILDGFLTISGHSIELILEVFDPVTGKPKEYFVVQDWPSMEYIASPTPSEFKVAIDCIVDNGSPQSSKSKVAVAAIKYAFKDTTILSLLNVLGALYNGNIDPKQYFATFKHMEKLRNSETSEQHIADANKAKFLLKYEGRYSVTQHNPAQDTINTHINTDKYLERLSEIELDDYSIPNDKLKVILKALQSKYKIQDEKICASDNYKGDIESIRREMHDIIDNIALAETFLKKPYKKSSKQITKEGVESMLAPKKLIDQWPKEDGYQDLKFIGREKTLKDINDAISQRRAAVITGMPGIGKTATALEYAWNQKKLQNDNLCIRWIKSDSNASIEEAFTVIGSDLGIAPDDYKNKDLFIRQVKQKLHNSNLNILFIFDNVQNYGDVEDYITLLSSKFKFIITTKDRTLVKDKNKYVSNVKHPEFFTVKEAEEYVDANLNEGRELTNEERKILKKHGRALPLTLSLAVGWLNNNRLGTAIEFKDFIEDKWDKIIKSLITPLPEAWKLIQYSSYLDSDFIPLTIVKAVMQIADDRVLESVIKQLEKLSFVNFVVQNNQYGIALHREVQEIVKSYAIGHKAESIEASVAIEQLIKALDARMPNIDNPQSKELQEAKLWALHAINILDNQHVKSQEAVNLAFKLAQYFLYIQYNYNKALEYCKTVEMIQPLSIEQNTLIGDLYRIKKDYGEALKYYNEALKLEEMTTDGKDTVNKVKLYNYIGYAYFGMGNLDKALKHCMKALKVEESLSPNQDTTMKVTVHISIGEIRSAQKELKSALTHYDKAAQMEELLNPGKDTINKIRILNNKGDVFQLQGQLDDALKMYKNALTREKSLPNKAILLNNIGEVYAKKDELDIAIEKYKEALSIMDNIGWNNNPTTINIIIKNIANAYQNKGDTVNAKKYFDAAKLREDSNPDGKAISTHQEGQYHEYYTTYSKKGIEDLLKLRLTGIETLDNIKVFSPNSVFEGNMDTTTALISDIMQAVYQIEAHQTLIIPLNIYSRHWVGITVEKDDNQIKVGYIDPEMQPIPESLKIAFMKALQQEFAGAEIILLEIEVERQKYNNCGPEVIEDFMLYLTGSRVDQESAVAIHSMLLEDGLLGTAY